MPSDYQVKPMPRPDCSCSAPSRRTFLVAAGAAAGRIMAGPFPPRRRQDGHLVPADKRLAPAWRASLTAPGEERWLTGEELRWVGLPVGGIACGQLYLAGDGRLWRWEIFRSNDRSDYGGMSSGIHYADPPEPGRDRLGTPVEQGFAVRVRTAGGEQLRPLDAGGWRRVAFRGEYPLARIRYRDPDCPLAVDLEAGSPFVPLDPDRSSLPLTVFTFTLHNRGREAVEAELAGWLENAVCPYDAHPDRGRRRNRIRRRSDRVELLCDALPAPKRPDARPDRLIADFEGEDYGDWTVTGTAFGDHPYRPEELAPYHDVRGYLGRGFANSHQTRHGEDVRAGDAHTGSLVSPEFVLDRAFLAFRIGGGNHPGGTEVQLLVDGEVVRRATGHDDNGMRREAFDLAGLEGRKARIRLLDRETGAWGNLGADHFVLTDDPEAGRRPEDLDGFGTIALALLDPAAEGAAVVPAAAPAAVLAALTAGEAAEETETPFDRRPLGALGRRLRLAPGERTELVFVLAWHFPDYLRVGGELASIAPRGRLRRRYGKRFADAAAVVAAYAADRAVLTDATRRWRDTWNDSTLPRWLLDRTFIPNDCLASQTCHWFDDDRFYGWEGVDCCPGTCQHVWQYAQGLARIFPSLERFLRERIDFGLAWHESGRMDYRAEAARGQEATDGAAGTIVRAWREHTMSPDGAFLARIWPRVKRSLEYLMDQDGDGDGLLEGRQYNTLDQAWYGPMGWISSLFLAAVGCGAEMAREMGDAAFAARCDELLARGRRALVEQLFDGEYFLHRPDPAHPEATNTNAGCHIDQVLGQSFAWQVGLPARVVPRRETVSALDAIWRYNFAPDAGAYRNAMQGVIPGGRWYALEGEAGLLMCTWPKGGADRAPGQGAEFAIGYFNECMNGFEYQVASHMIYEGEPGSELVERGLAVARAVHDRYDPARRNPYNEIECSDHYARSMAAYGVFLAACGYQYHGPRGHLGFAPRIRPEDFRAAFTAAEGWGSYWQRYEDGGRLRCGLEVRYGRLALRTLRLAPPPGARPARARLGDGTEVACVEENDGRVLIRLPWVTVLKAGEELRLELT